MFSLFSEAAPDDPSSDEGGPPGSTPQHAKSNGTGTPISSTPAPNGQLQHGGGGADTPDGRGCCYHPPLPSEGGALPSSATTTSGGGVCTYHGQVQCDCVLTANNNKDYVNTTTPSTSIGVTIGGGTTVNCVGSYGNHTGNHTGNPPSPAVGKYLIVEALYVAVVLT